MIDYESFLLNEVSNELNERNKKVAEMFFGLEETTILKRLYSDGRLTKLLKLLIKDFYERYDYSLKKFTEFSLYNSNKNNRNLYAVYFVAEGGNKNYKSVGRPHSIYLTDYSAEYQHCGEYRVTINAWANQLEKVLKPNELAIWEEGYKKYCKNLIERNLFYNGIFKFVVRKNLENKNDIKYYLEDAQSLQECLSGVITSGEDVGAAKKSQNKR